MAQSSETKPAFFSNAESRKRAEAPPVTRTIAADCAELELDCEDRPADMPPAGRSSLRARGEDFRALLMRRPYLRGPPRPKKEGECAEDRLR
jgi:hypothetical protein